MPLLRPPRRKTDSILYPALIAAAGFALAEVATGFSLLVVGGHDRADLATFVAVRPWLLLILMVALARWPVRARVGVALTGLALTSLGEWAWLAWHGGGQAGPIVCAFGAGVAVVALGEGLMGLVRWIGGRWRRPLAGLLGAWLLLLPGALPAFERIALGPLDPAARRERPRVALLSGLPLVWHEAGVAGTLDAPPPAILQLLAGNFTLQPIGTAETDLPPPESALLLVTQPRIGAAGLVAIDGWVRAGGRLLILTDPDLRWPTQLPPGDPALPPDATPLAPLLAHWGVTLSRDDGDPLAMRKMAEGGAAFQVRTGAPGKLASDACAVEGAGLVADCRIGKGRVVIVADADLLLDDLWVGVGSHGTGRFRRTADNGPFLVAMLDSLRGGVTAPVVDSVLWIDSDWLDLGWLLAVTPAFALLVAAFALRQRGANAALVTESPHTYPQPANRHKGGTMADFRHDER